MIKRIVFDSALVLALLSLTAPSASAACNPPKSVSTYNGVTGAYVYFHTTVPSPNGSYGLLGKIWDDDGDHTGTCNEFGTFLYFGAAPGNIGVNMSLGDACVPGCPTRTLSLQITASNTANQTQTIVTKVVETPAGANNFDFSSQAPADLELGSYPRPRVISSSRVGSTVNLSVSLDGSASLYRNGTGTDITGFNLVSASSLGDPGPRASLYALRSFVPTPGGAPGTGLATVDCSNFVNDQWIAAQLVSATGGPSNAVGPRTRVKCNPALANPHVAPKKGMGSGTSD
jgi:hypothetical protein